MAGDLGEMTERAVVRPTCVDCRLIVPSASEPDGLAIPSFGGWDDLESGFDIALEDFGIQIRERGLGGEIDEGVGRRRERLSPPPGCFGHGIVQRRPWVCHVEYNRFEAVQRGKGAGSGLLGQEDGGASTGMTEANGIGQTQIVDGGEDVGAKSGPGEISVGGSVRATVRPEVQSPTMELLTQYAGQRDEHLGTEAGGMDQQQVWSPASEVINGETETVRSRAPISAWKAVVGSRGHPATVVHRMKPVPLIDAGLAPLDRVDIGGLWGIFWKRGGTWQSSF